MDEKKEERPLPSGERPPEDRRETPPPSEPPQPLAPADGAAAQPVPEPPPPAPLEPAPEKPQPAPMPDITPASVPTPPEPPVSEVAPVPESETPPVDAQGGPSEGPEATATSEEPPHVSPLEEEVHFDIVEPPEEEETEDGFARIPAGPTEEVSFDEDSPRRYGRRRDRRGRGDRHRAPAREAVVERAEPETVVAPEAKRRFPWWIMVIIALAAAILAVIIILAVYKRSDRLAPGGQLRSPGRVMALMAKELTCGRGNA